MAGCPATFNALTLPAVIPKLLQSKGREELAPEYPKNHLPDMVKTQLQCWEALKP